MSTMSSNINSFDLAKFVMAYLVVAIHCGIREYSELAYKLFDLSVPVFFTISGFLLYRKITTGGVLLYVKRLLFMYAVYTIIYMPLTIWGVRTMSICDASISITQGILIMGENFCSWPLWYLWALIFGTIIVWLFSKCRVSVEGIAVLGVVLVFCARFMDALRPISGSIIAKADSTMIEWYYRVFLTTRNGLFVAVPYLSLGLLLAKYKEGIMSQKWQIIVALFLSMGCYLLRIPYAANLTAFCIVALLLMWKLPDSTYFKKLRNISTLAYFLHMYFVFFLSGRFPNFLIYWFVSAICVTALCLILLACTKQLRVSRCLY